MNIKNFAATISTVAALLSAGAASATPVNPAPGTFGQITPLSGSNNVTFNSNGIPTNAVNFQTFTDAAGNQLLLGLSATPRYDAPTPSNDGNGTFAVIPGLDPTHSSRPYWNFSFYAELLVSASIRTVLDIRTIGLTLLYDLDPAANTNVANMGSIAVSLFPNSTATVVQESQNIGSPYLYADNAGFNTKPAVTAFDPNHGEYSFRLAAAGFGNVDMNVNVVPLPAGLPLLGSGLAALALLRLRRKRAA